MTFSVETAPFLPMDPDSFCSSFYGLIPVVIHHSSDRVVERFDSLVHVLVDLTWQRTHLSDYLLYRRSNSVSPLDHFIKNMIQFPSDSERCQHWQTGSRRPRSNWGRPLYPARP